jgi:hypothetical protein
MAHNATEKVEGQGEFLRLFREQMMAAERLVGAK